VRKPRSAGRGFQGESNKEDSGGKILLEKKEKLGIPYEKTDRSRKGERNFRK